MRLPLFKMLAAVFIILAMTNFGYGFEIDNLNSKPLVLEQKDTPLSKTALSYLRQQPEKQVAVWVFFTDKEITTGDQFRQAADKISFDRHLLDRRAKVGMDKVTFADLPVSANYIDRIENEGGNLRRASRWLNAASFEINIDDLDNIKDLPFVYEIRPVATFKRIVADTDGDETETEGLKLSPDESTSLDYGSSFSQNYMINIPAMHDLGYNGQGVIVAMLDGGYRKSHDAFAQLVSEGRLLDEYDFVFDDDNTQNEAEDVSSQHNHGTSTWSTLGGYDPGSIIGPAYGASFLLAKTEDLRSETVVEEDNWVAGLEWADSLGADVASTSLGYSDWYSYSDYDGVTAITSAAASTAAAMGIIVCNSMGNSGPGAGTLTAPADAYDILSVGAVSSSYTIAYFSSRGPTYDGRTKPEVCARGVSTYCAEGTSDNYYTTKNGTSLSTPLVGGACAVLLSANPSLTPLQIRQAMMETANNADTPDNNYGWGIINTLQAFNWGANFNADATIGWESLTVNFQDSSSVAASSWKWHFGDGDSSVVQNPTHTYSAPGAYTVTLTVESPDGTLDRVKEKYITVLADTLTFADAGADPGDTAVMAINLTNSQELENILIPVKYDVHSDFRLVDYSLGSRTKNYDGVNEIMHDTLTGELVIELATDISSKGLPLSPGSGEIARLMFVIDPAAAPGSLIQVDTGLISGHEIALSNPYVTYGPIVYGGDITIYSTLRGDADNSGDHNLLDIVYLINYIYRDGEPPSSLRAGDADSSDTINILDVTYLIDYLYRGGPAPAE